MTIDPVSIAIAALISWGVNTMLAPEVNTDPICYVHKMNEAGEVVEVPRYCKDIKFKE